MKKYSLLILVVFSAHLCFGQGFISPEYYNPSTPNPRSGNSTLSRDLVRTTGYILDAKGNVQKKISIKVIAIEDLSGERIIIKSYLNVSELFGANWENVTIRAYIVGGPRPPTELKKVENANFAYWAPWNNNKIWFNL